MNKKISYFDIISNFFLLVLCFLLILKIFVYQQVNVDGLSMYPNYNDKDLLVMNLVDKNFQRGQVMAVYANDEFAKKVTQMNPLESYLAKFDCQNPNDVNNCNAVFYLKRIIGLPNEEVEIIGRNVIIYNQEYPNGTVLKEDYIPETNKQKMDKYYQYYYFPRTKIPANHYFVMGDNRTNSKDSRAIGPIADYAMFGQESFRVGNWDHNHGNPFDTADIFTRPNYTYSTITSEQQQALEKAKTLK
jgi:signal peptidase I